MYGLFPAWVWDLLSDMLWPLHTWTHSCGCMHKTCMRWSHPKSQHHNMDGGRIDKVPPMEIWLRIPTIDLYIGNLWLLGKGRVSFSPKDIAPDKLPTAPVDGPTSAYILAAPRGLSDEFKVKNTWNYEGRGNGEGVRGVDLTEHIMCMYEMLKKETIFVIVFCIS